MRKIFQKVCQSVFYTKHFFFANAICSQEDISKNVEYLGKLFFFGGRGKVDKPKFTKEVLQDIVYI
jgi:hypothetical protein